MTIKFKLRRPEEEQTALFVEFKFQGQKITLFPGKTVDTTDWSITKQGLKSGLILNGRIPDPLAAELNDFLRSWRDEVERIVTTLHKSGEFVTKHKIQEALDTKYKPAPPDPNKPVDFITFIDAYLKSKETDLNPHTIQIYLQVKRFLICAFKLAPEKQITDYHKLNNKLRTKFPLKANKPLPFADINDAFLQNFKIYMQTAKFWTKEAGIDVEKLYSKNYIAKQQKDLNTLIIAAKATKLVQEFSTTVKIQHGETDPVFLSWREITEIGSVECEDPTEKLVQDRFVVNCHFGMRVSDLNKIEKSNFKPILANGEEVIVYQNWSQKTKRRIEFPLEPEAVAIMTKYDYKFPYVSDKHFNDIIKKIAEKAGLTEIVTKTETRGLNQEFIVREKKCNLISSHCCRRSFASNMYEAGLDVPTIMSITAHSSVKEFMKYISKDSVQRIDVTHAKLKKIREKRFKLKVA